MSDDVAQALAVIIVFGGIGVPAIVLGLIHAKEINERRRKRLWQKFVREQFSKSAKGKQNVND